MCKEAAKPATTPAEMTRCETKLTRAREIAVGFGLDCQPIDVKLSWVRQVRGGDRMTTPTASQPAPGLPGPVVTSNHQPGPDLPLPVVTGPRQAHPAPAPTPVVTAANTPAGPAIPLPMVTTANPPAPAPVMTAAAPKVPAPVTTVAAPPAPAMPAPVMTAAVPLHQASTPSLPSADAMVSGQTVLDKARLELKRGQTEMARQLATEVYNGPYGLQAEAAQVLRSIDVEEHNQRVLAANRAIDAGMAAFRSKDYSQAMAVFRQVDANLLAAGEEAAAQGSPADLPEDGSSQARRPGPGACAGDAGRRRDAVS